jgi:colanic acid/amylovoran biosynthesis protein
VRFADYTNLSLAGIGALRFAIDELASGCEMNVQALPISRHPGSDDLVGVTRLLQGFSTGRLILDDIATTAELVHATAGCRAVVTASYHAAVFALAAGVPAVCISNSPYYDGKFRGLVDLFPHAAEFIQLQRSGSTVLLRQALARAWNASVKVREGAWMSARRQIGASQALYARFADQVDRPARAAVPRC